MRYRRIPPRRRGFVRYQLTNASQLNTPLIPYPETWSGLATWVRVLQHVTPMTLDRYRTKPATLVDLAQCVTQMLMDIAKVVSFSITEEMYDEEYRYGAGPDWLLEHELTPRLWSSLMHRCLFRYEATEEAISEEECVYNFAQTHLFPFLKNPGFEVYGVRLDNLEFEHDPIFLALWLILNLTQNLSIGVSNHYYTYIESHAQTRLSSSLRQKVTPLPHNLEYGQWFDALEVADFHDFNLSDIVQYVLKQMDNEFADTHYSETEDGALTIHEFRWHPDDIAFISTDQAMAHSYEREFLNFAQWLCPSNLDGPLVKDRVHEVCTFLHASVQDHLVEHPKLLIDILGASDEPATIPETL